MPPLQQSNFHRQKETKAKYPSWLLGAKNAKDLYREIHEFKNWGQFRRLARKTKAALVP